MFTSKTIAVAAAAVAFSAIGIAGANAAPRDGGFYGHGERVAVINHRIRKQSRRIRRARRQGRLSWVQARRVGFELSHIRGFRAMYLADGRLSFRENRHLHRLLNQNHRRIRRMAGGPGGGWGGWGGWRDAWFGERDARGGRFGNHRGRNLRAERQPPKSGRFDGFRQ